MTSTDPRPPVWVGHVTLPTPDLPATREFMLALGMRDIAHGEGFAVLELRGGTHLVLLPADEPASSDAYFDLMVEDLPATHEDLRAAGLAPSGIEECTIRSSLTIDSPSGHLHKLILPLVSELRIYGCHPSFAHLT